MKTRFGASFCKLARLLAVLSVLACIAASCGPDKSRLAGPHCAFTDAKMMSALGICNIAAEYYMEHHEWPLSIAQLEDQWRKILDATKEMRPEDAAQGREFLNRFTRLELRKKGDNLLLRYSFRV